MQVAIVDLETTSLDVTTCRIVEFAAIVFDTDENRVISTLSCLVNDGNTHIPVDITKINGVSNKLLQYGYSPEKTMALFADMTKNVQFMIAHNGSGYDWLILQRYMKLNKPLLDSKTDIKWQASSKRLIHLVAEMGCQVMTAHTALADCLMLLELLKKKNCWQDLLSIVSTRGNKICMT